MSEELPSELVNELSPSIKIQIEKNIPIPKIDFNNPRRCYCKYPEMLDCIEKMEIGDSIIVDSHKKVNSCWQYAKKLGFKICSRKTENIMGRKGKRRIWRVK